MEEYYAHTADNIQNWEPIAEHLKKTSDLAEMYADEFGEGSAGKWLGFFHDVGKASDLFQGVLKKKEHNVNHAAAGAFISSQYKLSILSKVIYAHHDGLYWNIDSYLKESYKTSGSYDNIGKRFAVSGKEQYTNMLNYIKKIEFMPGEKPLLKVCSKSFYKNLPEMLHTRMLLSCLCDADYTATASLEDESILKDDDIKLDSKKVFDVLTEYRNNIISSSKANGELNYIRNKVYDDCVKVAEYKPGLFTLTAPTGTGKTLALLAFALKHALKNNKRRIIIVLPFLSIINQNADIYRKITPDILEAHSMANYENDDFRRLSERWNASVIITTSVKFFEAFFKSNPSDLRFLHSISNSVIVFDEAQSIPHNLAGTTIETVRMLCEMFGCSVLLSTATQPSFNVRKDICFNAVEVMENPYELYEKTRRVDVVWNIDNPVSLESIAYDMSERKNVCCVLNRKDHTHKLFDILIQKSSEEECFYISTDMCAAHRIEIINEITYRLKNNLPCRLVSTSCIEAGVDLDFEYMYRALAPLEAIIQCAGRCNRNGNLKGKMVVFVPDEMKLYPVISYGNSAEKVKLILSRHSIDIYNPDHIREYYTEIFSDSEYDHDSHKLVDAIENHDFIEAEKHYRFISKSGVNVLVPYDVQIDDYEILADEARKKGISKQWMRKAASLTVSCYREDKLRDIAEQCWIYTKHGKQYVPGWYILLDKKSYDKNSGLHFDDDSSLDYLI